MPSKQGPEFPFLIKHGKYRSAHHREQPGNGNRQAAHGAFNLAHFQGLGGAHGVRRGPQPNALGYGLGNPQELV